VRDGTIQIFFQVKLVFFIFCDSVFSRKDFITFKSLKETKGILDLLMVSKRKLVVKASKG